MKQRSCDGRGNAPKKTGARSARARTRGQNLLVLLINIMEVYIAWQSHPLLTGKKF
jgi:hypothetical protein